MRYRSEYPGQLVLPDGVKVATGETCEADPKNAGVAEWIASGWLVAEPPPVASKAKSQ